MDSWSSFDLNLKSLKLSRGVDRPLTLREIQMIWDMALIHTPDIEMAHSLDFRFSVWIAYKVKYPEIQRLIEKGRAVGANGLRKAQFEAALHGNVPMQIWLGKCILGQNSTDFTQPSGQPAQLGDISLEAKQHLLELRNAIYKKPVEVEVELTDVKSEVPPPHVGSSSLDDQA